MIRVGVNGYGTIGRRVADGVRKQKDMELVGVTAVHPHYKYGVAREKGIDLYALDMKSLEAFNASGYTLKGTLNDLLHRVDVVVDAGPDDTGPTNLNIYSQAKVKSIFNGGAGDDMKVQSFVAQCNFEAAAGREALKVVSCNTTGLCRTINAIDGAVGVSRARAVLARRATDPDDVKKGPIDSVVLDPTTLPSHHGPDVQTVLPHINIVTMAFKVPTTHMHLHSLILSLKKQASKEDVVRALQAAPRMNLVDGKSGFKSTANIMDWAREKGRDRNDVYEATVWKDSVTVVDGEAYMFLAVHQEAIVVPEDIDAIRAVAGGYTREESMRLTDESLGIRTKG
ncbi:MAG: type II glyceraldehyde-3-phosphate dehydrogenase [Nitrososphaerota archaeon]|nr:type II glyceraldehyde-3-phosphate dehydrogenase [Nitrososphaerota archaeon]MDG7023210.1 type II glyceraldehyde-3-phosphate dehydrogenase [Nitrososphaerota archaeon]